MTAAAPEVTEALADLDFAAPVLCDVATCQTDKINAAVAVALSAYVMPCHDKQRHPVCEEHLALLVQAKAEHVLVECAVHLVSTCAHLVIQIEPLP